MDGMNPITRKEIYLAKVAGDQVETPEPITREEMYLKKIAEGGGGSDLPDTPAEDGTYALQNTVESGTGTLSWTSGGGGSSVLNVTQTVADNVATLNKTWQEIYDAFTAGAAVNLVDADAGAGSTYVYRAVDVEDDGVGQFGVIFWSLGDEWGNGYFCDAANKNPARSLS